MLLCFLGGALVTFYNNFFLLIFFCTHGAQYYKYNNDRNYNIHDAYLLE